MITHNFPNPFSKGASGPPFQILNDVNVSKERKINVKKPIISFNKARSHEMLIALKHI